MKKWYVQVNTKWDEIIKIRAFNKDDAIKISDSIWNHDYNRDSYITLQGKKHHIDDITNIEVCYG